MCDFKPVNWLTSANHINKEPALFTQKHDNADDTTHINNIPTGYAFYVVMSTKICSLNSSNFIGALFGKENSEIVSKGTSSRGKLDRAMLGLI